MIWFFLYFYTGSFLGAIFDIISMNNERVQERRGAYFLLWVLIWPISLSIMIYAFVSTAIKLIRARKK
jgi:hypothetical protein